MVPWIMWGPNPWDMDIIVFAFIITAVLLLTFAVLVNRSTPAGIALMLVGDAALHSGIAAMILPERLLQARSLNGAIIYGAILVLAGVAILLAAIEVMRLGSKMSAIADPLKRSKPFGVSLLLFGVTYLVVAVMSLFWGENHLQVVGYLIFGTASVIAGSTIFYRPEWLSRLSTWLTKRYGPGSERNQRGQPCSSSRQRKRLIFIS
jgi:hypothetical protein